MRNYILIPLACDIQAIGLHIREMAVLVDTDLRFLLIEFLRVDMHIEVQGPLVLSQIPLTDIQCGLLFGTDIPHWYS